MKPKIFNLFFLIIFLTSSYLTPCQNYRPIAIENAHWLINYDDSNTMIIDSVLGYITKGDTIINNTNYKKVYKRIFEATYGNYSPPYEVIHEFLYGVIRDDTINRIVYAIQFHGQWLTSCPINEEFILYDFSLNQGDTADLCINLHGAATIDTIYYDSIIYFTWVFEGFDVTYFEGIGSISGLFEALGILCDGICYWLEDYCVGTDEECGVLFVKVDNILKDKIFKIAPNPSNGLFKISKQINEQISMQIINNIGKIIYEDFIDAPEKKFNLFLNPGLYIIKFFNKSELIESKRLIIVR